MIYSDYVSREQLRALLILICSSMLIIFSVCAHSADSLQHHCESSELEPYWRSSQGFFLTWKKKSIAILLLHYVHLSSKPDTSALKEVLRSCHGYKVTLWAWPCVELFYSPLSRWKSTWPNCQSQAFITSKPDWIHRSAKTFIRWQCGAFLKPCWHSQFASQTLATRMLHFENRCSAISLLGWNTWSYYTEKGP